MQCQLAAANAGILTALCNFAFNSTYPAKNAFLKAVAELIRGNEQNQTSFHSFITRQGPDALITCLRLCFDTHQV